MKKTRYIAPTVTETRLSASSALLTASQINPDGINNFDSADDGEDDEEADVKSLGGGIWDKGW